MKKANLPTRWELMIRDKPKEILNTYEKVISFVLKTYMHNETGECFPTNIQIAHGASCDVKTVRKVMRKLVKLGLLKRWKVKPKSGTGHYHYHYKAIIYGEHSSSFDSTLRNKKVNIEESQIHNKGNNIPPNYEDNYTNNSDLNNRQSNVSRADGLQKLSVVEFLKNINKKNLELND